MAGLNNNDILVAVNGERVDGLDHESVVEKIKQSEERTSLLVVDKETDSMYKLVRKCKLLLGTFSTCRKCLRDTCIPATPLTLVKEVTKHPNLWPLLDFYRHYWNNSKFKHITRKVKACCQDIKFRAT